MNFSDAFRILMGIERGYTADPNDPGNWTGGVVGHGLLIGTNGGISAPVAVAHGVVATAEAMKALTPAFVQQIAKAEYWDVYQCDQMPFGIAYMILDTAYNGGHPVQWLQQALGMVVDGHIGPKTIAAANAQAVPLTVGLMCSSRLDYMANQRNVRDGAGSWMRRVATCLRIGGGIVT